MPCYFAYGSNMNSARMAERGLNIVRAISGQLAGYRLCFNKLARHNPAESRANIQYAPLQRVEGVLYQLESHREIAKLDPFEGAPRYYGRERYTIETSEGVIPAWVYVANPAVIGEGVLPPKWYVEHLLAGKEYLSDDYFSALKRVPCQEGLEGTDVR